MSFNKIFNIDFNKSGTTSLTKAVSMLGIKSIHYAHNKKPLYKTLEENKRHNKPLLHSLETYTFFSDFEGFAYFKELDKQYPNSKYILTIRDLNQWLLSREKHVLRNQQKPHYTGTFLTVDKQKWKQYRKRVIQETHDYFRNRPQDFLVIDICAGEGWDVLCPFLEQPIPKKPFPHKNSTASIEEPHNFPS